MIGVSLSQAVEAEGDSLFLVNPSVVSVPDKDKPVQAVGVGAVERFRVFVDFCGSRPIHQIDFCDFFFYNDNLVVWQVLVGDVAEFLCRVHGRRPEELAHALLLSVRVWYNGLLL